MKEIVIKISEDAYDYLINTHFVENTKYIFNQSAEDRKHTMQLFEVIDAVKNGTPLPEHHGRLIDADDLLTDTEQRIFLKAMSREVCQKVDDEYSDDDSKVLLVKVCDSIERKVKKIWE